MKPTKCQWTSLVAQMVKNVPAMQETRVGFSWVGKIPWRRKWQPTPVFFPGEFHGQRSLVGHRPLGHKELDTTEQLTHTHKCQAPSYILGTNETNSPGFIAYKGHSPRGKQPLVVLCYTDLRNLNYQRLCVWIWNHPQIGVPALVHTHGSSRRRPRVLTAVGFPQLLPPNSRQHFWAIMWPPLVSALGSPLGTQCLKVSTFEIR